MIEHGLVVKTMEQKTRALSQKMPQATETL